MSIQIEVRGLRKALDRFKTMQSNLADPGPALKRAGIVVRDSAVRRLSSNGGDQSWAPTLRGGAIGVNTGRMRSSIGVTQTGSRTVTVGTNVKYARYFQFGTGIYAGHGPIRPKGAKALSFVVNGHRYVLASVKGQPPRPFLLINDADRQKIKAIFVRYATGKTTQVA